MPIVEVLYMGIEREGEDDFLLESQIFGRKILPRVYKAFFRRKVFVSDTIGPFVATQSEYSSFAEFNKDFADLRKIVNIYFVDKQIYLLYEGTLEDFLEKMGIERSVQKPKEAELLSEKPEEIEEATRRLL